MRTGGMTTGPISISNMDGESLELTMPTGVPGIKPRSHDDPFLTKCKAHFDHMLKTSSQNTNKYWLDWIRQSNYTGSWKEAVHRSTLALKLLIFEPTGAVIASPTFSLPEFIAGVRNWDYRASWIRDSSFTLYALIRLGFTQEANGSCPHSLTGLGPTGELGMSQVTGVSIKPLTGSNLDIGVLQVSPSTFTSSFPISSPSPSSPNKLSVKNSLGKSPFQQSASLGRATLGIAEGSAAAAGGSTTVPRRSSAEERFENGQRIRGEY
ncbi:Six-hairpin glycosidase-like protein [Amanita muscaria]